MKRTSTYNSFNRFRSKFFWLAIKISIVIGCTYFMYQKLVENDTLQFSDFYQNLTKNNLFLSKNILILVFFSVFNHFLEVLKWEALASFCTKIDKKTAFTQSLASLTTSLITPNRIGEYGAKAMYFEKKQRKQIVGLNLVGNFYQLLATLFFGIIGFAYFYYNNNVYINFRRVMRILLLGLFLISAFFFGAKHFRYRGYGAEKARKFIDKIPFSLNLKVAFLAFFRYVVFSHQFYFLLILFNVEISYIDAITAIASVYFVASIIPMLSLFDVVLKGTVAVWIFSFFDIPPITILTITTLMWILNFVVPAIIGSYFVLTFKPIANK